VDLCDGQPRCRAGNYRMGATAPARPGRPLAPCRLGTRRRSDLAAGLSAVGPPHPHTPSTNRHMPHTVIVARSGSKSRCAQLGRFVSMLSRSLPVQAGNGRDRRLSRVRNLRARQAAGERCHPSLRGARRRILLPRYGLRDPGCKAAQTASSSGRATASSNICSLVLNER
jgi:hypothetical protein